MKKLIPILIVCFFSISAFAQKMDVCEDFKSIHKFSKSLNAENIEKLLPRAEWLNDVIEAQKKKRLKKHAFDFTLLFASTFIFNTVFPTTLLLEAKPLSDGTVTSSYTRSAKDFSRFLKLEPKYACQYLRFGDEGARRLGIFTHHLHVELEYYKGH